MIAVSPIAFASHDSPPISFTMGDVTPYGTANWKVQLTLTKVPLIQTEVYSITCHILNPNWDKTYPIMMGMYTDGSATITLNGLPLSSGQAPLVQSDNFYAASPVYGYNTLTFENFDNSDTATVTNCLATPVG